MLNVPTDILSVAMSAPDSENNESSNAAISKKPNILISPNPFNDFITILVNNEPNQLYGLKIYNTLGQTVQQIENINSEKKNNRLWEF